MEESYVVGKNLSIIFLGKNVSQHFYGEQHQRVFFLKAWKFPTGDVEIGPTEKGQQPCFFWLLVV